MKLKIIFSRIFLLTLLMSLSGCVGVHFSYKVEKESWMIPTHNVKGWSVSEKIKKDYVYTKQEVIDLIGEPRKSWSKDGYEYLSYGKGEWRFSGAVVYIIIPIPLLLPIGIKDEIVVFKDDRLEKVIRIGTDTYFIGCVLTKWEDFHPTCLVGNKEFPKY